MYETNGEFGKARICDALSSSLDRESLFCYSRIFWHSCNDLYTINRPEGAHSFLVLLTLDGNGVLEVKGSSYALTQGKVAVIPPQTPHTYFCKTDSQWTFYGIHILANCSAGILNRLINENGICFTHKNTQELADSLEHIITESRLCSHQITLSISKLISDFIHDLYIHQKTASMNKAGNFFEKATEYIELNYASNIDINELSTRFFTSTSHFIRTFKQHAGVTPYQYIENYRLLQARRLLSYSRMSIADIASKVGYKSPSNFISYFKRDMGVTPSVYRRNIDKYEKSIDDLPPLLDRDGTDVNSKYRVY